MYVWMYRDTKFFGFNIYILSLGSTLVSYKVYIYRQSIKCDKTSILQVSSTKTIAPCEHLSLGQSWTI